MNLANDEDEQLKMLENQEKNSDSTPTPRSNAEDDKTDILLHEKIHDYIDAFTVHGLTRVFHSSRIESVFWIVVVTLGIMLTSIVTQGLFVKYFRYDIYTEVKSQVTNANYFPSVIICEDHLLKKSYFAFCAASISDRNLPDVCDKKLNDYPDTANMTENKANPMKNRWSNGMFTVTTCYTWGGQLCLTPKYFKSLRRFNNTCIQFNYDGDMHDLYSHIVIKFQYTPPPQMRNRTPNIVVIPIDHRIHEIDLTSTIAIEPKKKYYIVLDKTQHRRLPSPYPSNCSDLKQGDIFPGKYGRRQCIESYIYKEMIKECGFVFDYVGQFLDQDFVNKYKRNTSLTEGAKCLKKFTNQHVTDKQGKCTFPCDEIEFGMSTSFIHDETEYSESEKYVYTMDLNYRIVDTYTIYEEKVLYAWEQMACEIGGFIGLVIGASIISLVEIIVCLLMKGKTYINKIPKLRKKSFVRKDLSFPKFCLSCKHKLGRLDSDDKEVDL